ncbi:type III-A CRISPR-associated protein Cas10/Csm1 [Desulfurobacterium indicum]|uniref:CRISPR system single-strand-specific deoxyribonuclease Cas10/Csm1 (subtype III-A) n=1 Tax=Desulfurobacterium indicum TaxID=1914305 RepID=A0A1R1MKP2_9BACT|nr:type III-A CRISPR-associated protein Cas10/Csm1 [Desulfurobacterium indicum]OMH40388.1 type III-A CRISPR-associated protein Cas10/Csm1 [Desulfurobacterium indicum]
MNRELEITATAALLHDIGKFYRRAESKRDSHQVMSEKAILEKLTDGLKKFFTDSEIKEIASLVRNHHYEREKLDNVELTNFLKAVIDGDRHSAGLDRHNTEEKYDEKQATEKSPLVCIFEEIAYNKKKINDISELLSNDVYVYKFKKLSPENAFPIKKSAYYQTDIDYSSLWSKFIKEFNSLKGTSNFNLFFEAMKSIIIKYTWCIPSSTYSPRGFSIPDVPLCDHLTSSAAIATASYRWRKNNSGKKPRYILLSGDFSGIQNFIFSRHGESKKYAAKILRAKSLLVSFALETVITKIAEKFKVNRACLLINAGGKFTMVLPDIDTEKRIKQIKEELEEALIKNHYGLLSINLAFVRLEPEDFEKGRFLNKLKELHIKEGNEKFKSFSIDNEEKFAIRDYIQSLKGKTPCSICGVRPKKENSEMCSLCEYLKELGEKLPKSKAMKITINEKTFPLPEIKVYRSEKELNSEYVNADTDTLIFSIGESITGIPSRNINVHLPKNSKTEVLSEKIKTEIIKRCHEDEKELPDIKTFCQLGMESLIEDGEGTLRGKPFISVLKADVDNLGFIFMKGFVGIENAEEKSKQSLYSVSRVLYLSRMIDYFFSVVLTEKIRNKYRNIYTVFAGGDDLFLIGPWEDMLKFVKEMEEDFRKYVSYNPDLTFSSGILITKPDVPVYFLAEGAEEQLEKSKDTKNCITVFGKTATYEDFKKLLKISDELEREVENKNISTTSAYKLINLSEMANKIYKNAQNALWKAYLAYLTDRNYGKDNHSNISEEDKKTFLKNWIKYIEKYSENISKKNKENKLYIAIAKALYRRRRYGN